MFLRASLQADETVDEHHMVIGGRDVHVAQLDLLLLLRQLGPQCGLRRDGPCHPWGLDGSGLRCSTTNIEPAKSAGNVRTIVWTAPRAPADPPTRTMSRAGRIIALLNARHVIGRS